MPTKKTEDRFVPEKKTVPKKKKKGTTNLSLFLFRREIGDLHQSFSATAFSNHQPQLID
ncbi:MAG: hypothetical protein WBC88_08080 [Candidatus Zixiibacteriota bacterium]